MTAKEKAQELLSQYAAITGFALCDEEVKDCALVAVDELINAFDESGGAGCETGHIVGYWNDVKQEIKAL